MQVGSDQAMTDPRVVVTGLGVVSPFGLGCSRFWDSVRCGHSATRLVEEFDTVELACRVAAPVRGVTIDDLPPIDGDDMRDPELSRRSETILAGGAARRDCGARSVERRRSAGRRGRRRRASSAAAAAASMSASVSTRTSSSSAAASVTPYAIPVVDRRDDVERDLHLAAAARREPRAVVRLHQLDRRASAMRRR